MLARFGVGENHEQDADAIRLLANPITAHTPNEKNKRTVTKVTQYALHSLQSVKILLREANWLAPRKAEEKILSPVFKPQWP